MKRPKESRKREQAPSERGEVEREALGAAAGAVAGPPGAVARAIIGAS